MEQNTAQQPTVITQDVIKAKFNKQLTLLKYQNALQNLIDYQITEDNMVEAQEKLKEGRKTLTVFKTIHKEGKAPAWQECLYWDAVYNSINDPYETELNRKSAILNKLGIEQAKKKAAQDKEIKRIADIKLDIDNTLLNYSQTIAAAIKPDTLVSIEKMLGSLKANKNRFQEFLPVFVERCNELTPKIKAQKEHIRELEELESQKVKAQSEGNNEKVMEILEQKEAIEDKISESKVEIQGLAIDQSLRRNETQITPTQFATVSARRTSWEAEISTEPKSLEKAFKAGLLDCELNKEKIKQILNALKSSKILDDKEEYILDGVRYFKKMVY